jgi:hypothetical protein
MQYNTGNDAGKQKRLAGEGNPGAVLRRGEKNEQHKY